MASDKEQKPKACTSCDGDGGWWDTGNGEKFKNRRWVSCPACNSSGVAS